MRLMCTALLACAWVAAGWAMGHALLVWMGAALALSGLVLWAGRARCAGRRRQVIAHRIYTTLRRITGPCTAYSLARALAGKARP